uniref:Serine/threonine-protein phosphatase n=1 Tax=Strongyloides papillosus TaxID=174720 RepID=A0A0N5BYL0_STREA
MALSQSSVRKKKGNFKSNNGNSVMVKGASGVGNDDLHSKQSVAKNMNNFINRLTNLWTPARATLLFSESEIIELCLRARESFWASPMLAKIDPPCHVFGDIHGQYEDLLAQLHNIGYPPKSRLVFLGDYVDRGSFSIECAMLLFSLKVRYPNDIILVRGNHESRPVTMHYGFYTECERRYSKKVYDAFMDAFCSMPISVLIGNTILGMHGGISEDISSIQQLEQMSRPYEIPIFGPASHFTWSDPDPDSGGFDESPRGAGFLFNEQALAEFLNLHNLQLVVRGHQVVKNGFEFFGERKLATIFSAPNYKKKNTAAVMYVSKQFEITFKLFKNVENLESHRKNAII